MAAENVSPFDPSLAVLIRPVLEGIMNDAPRFDPVDRPEHYNSHPSGVECVQITEHMTCMIGCAIKYLWRNGLKAGADADEDLRKAIWCIERERSRLARMKANNGK